MTARLPPIPLPARARNGLRRVRVRWRRVFARTLPAWLSGNSEPIPPAQHGGTLALRSQTVTQARAALLDPTARTSSIELRIEHWRAPLPGWSGRLGPVSGLVAHSIDLPLSGTGEAVVTVRVAAPQRAQVLLDAALAALDPARPLPSTSRAEFVVAGPARPGWLRTGAVEARDWPPLESGRPASSDQTWPALPPVDLRLTSDDYCSYGLRTPVEGILVDVTTANPIDRGPVGPPQPIGELTMGTEPDGEIGWQVRATSGRSTVTVAAGRAGQPLDDAHRTALGRLGGATHRRGTANIPAMAQASVLAQLAATGLVLESPDLPPATAALLEPELAQILAAPLPASKADRMLWEQRGIAQRRAALRGHGPVTLSPSGPMPRRQGLPTVSGLLVTRRPDYLPRVMRDLAGQTYPHLEIILGLHGVEIDAAVRSGLADLPFPVEVLALPGDLRLGEALAAVTKMARGSLVTKVDDDDRYGPEHVWDLVLARQYSGATMVGRPSEFVHLSSYDATVRRRMASETYTEVVAGGTMMLSRGDLEAVGGWRPVARSVDRALLDRVLAAGGLVYRTHAFGFVYSRHDDGHTWDPGARYFLNNPAGRWPGYPPYPDFPKPGEP